MVADAGDELGAVGEFDEIVARSQREGLGFGERFFLDGEDDDGCFGGEGAAQLRRSERPSSPGIVKSSSTTVGASCPARATALCGS